MMRLLSTVILGFTIALAVPVGSDAFAKKRAMSCKAAGLDGKKTSWTCKAGQTCCWNMLLNQGTCGTKGAACM